MSRRPPIFFLYLLVIVFAVAAASHEPGLPARLSGSSTLTVTEGTGWTSIQQGTEYRKFTLERIEPYQLIELKLLRFDSRWILPRIVHSAQYQLRSADVRTLAEKSGALAMINANYFDEKGKPLGFLKTGGEEINSSISKSSLFTGIFGIRNFLPFIVHRDDFRSQQADEGLQAGPLLLADGRALAVTRGAGRQSRRSLIGLDKERRLIVAVTDSLFGGLNWVELQEIFSADRWKIDAANLLNLDGGGSAQLYVRSVQFEELVPGASDVPVGIGFFKR